MFITVEGGEGAGKTTLIDKLYTALVSKGKRVIKTFAPGQTKVGHLIRDILLHRKQMTFGARCELLLFLADRTQHVDEVIFPALQRGEIVLCDRYNDSTLAYQGKARGLDEKMVAQLCSFATNNLNPDLTLYLDLDPEEGLRREKHKDRMGSEQLAFHQKIREAYLQIAAREPKRFHVLDASLPAPQVYNEAIKLIDAILLAHR